MALQYEILPVTPVPTKLLAGLVLRDPRGRVDRPRRRAAATAGGRAGARADAQGHLAHTCAHRPCRWRGPAVAQAALPIIGPHPGDQFWIDGLAQQSQMFGFPAPSPLCRSAGWPMATRSRSGGDADRASLPGAHAGACGVLFRVGRPRVCGRRAVCRKHRPHRLPRGNHGQLIDAIQHKLLTCRMRPLSFQAMGLRPALVTNVAATLPAVSAAGESRNIAPHAVRPLALGVHLMADATLDQDLQSLPSSLRGWPSAARRAAIARARC